MNRRAHTLRRRYGRAIVKTAKDRRREADVILKASSVLMTGRRMEVHGKAGLVLYMGSSSENRRDPFWYEHPGGRTYKATPQEIVRTVLPHVGYEALEHAKVLP